MSDIFGAIKSENLRSIVDICFAQNPKEFSYHQLNQAIELDGLSSEQYRLLPLLYCKSDRKRFSEITRSKIEGSYKHTLFRNNLLLHRANDFKNLLIQDQFAEPIFTKGISYCLRSSLGIGIRPMADVDLVIQDLHFEPEKIINFLKRHHFQVTGRSIRSITAISADGFYFDLHWYLASWALSANLIQLMVKNSEQIRYRAYSLRIPCIEHHFVYLLSHGILSYGMVYDARWVVDALTVLTEYPNLSKEKAANFINHFSAKMKFKNFLQRIAEELPENIQINREFLIDLSKEIRPESKLVAWLFTEPLPPKKNSYIAYQGYRVSCVRAPLVSHLFEPCNLWLHNKLPFSRSLGLSQAFPPSSLLKSFHLIVIKFLHRSFSFIVNTFRLNERYR